MATKNKPVLFRLQDDVYDLLDAVQARSGMTKTQIVTDALESFLGNKSEDIQRRMDVVRELSAAIQSASRQAALEAKKRAVEAREPKPPTDQPLPPSHRVKAKRSKT